MPTLRSPRLLRLRAAGRRRLKAVAAACCAVGLLLQPLPAAAQVRLPALGDVASEELSVGSERRFGEQIMREVRRDPAYLDDPVLQEYLQSLWQPLVDAARRRGDIGPDVGGQFAWETFLVLDRSVNAFALPGGYVGVHLGLIALTASRDELASVLAHELSHVTQRHIARSMASASRQGAVGLAAMLLGMIAASRSGNADVAQAAIAGSQAAVLQGQLNFSRDMEREADRIGFGVFDGAGFSASGMAAMFDKLDHASRLNDSGAFPYLRSHPLTVDRMAEARARTAFAAAAGRRSDTVHEMMRARARVLMDPDAQGWRRLTELSGRDASDGDRVGRAYAAALAAARLGERSLSDQALGELARSLDAGTDGAPEAARQAAMLRAEVLLGRGQTEGAAKLELRPGGVVSRPVLLMRAEAALLDQARPGAHALSVHEAEQSLQAWLAERNGDAAAWAMVARCADALGNRLQSLRAQAEARAALGDLGAAIDRLRSAQRASRGASGADFVDASVIDARLRDFEERRRELASSARGASGGRPPEWGIGAAPRTAAKAALAP